MLNQWRLKEGDNATYKKLVQILVGLGQSTLILKIFDFLPKKEESSASAEGSTWKLGKVINLTLPLEIMDIYRMTVPSTHPVCKAILRDIFLQLITLVDSSRRVRLHGPKGAGKSTTLILLAMYLVDDKRDVIYISSEDAYFWNEHGCKLLTTVESQLPSVGNHTYVLADFGFTSPNSMALGPQYSKMMLLVSRATADEHFSVVVSFSNGNGWLMAYVDDTERKEAQTLYFSLKNNMLHASLQVTNFTLNEVALYLKSVEVPRGFPSSEDVFALTKGNPLLLSSLTSRDKHTYSLLDLEIEIESLLAPLVASLIRNILKNDVIKYLFGENCDLLAALAEAEEMISVDKFRHKR